jgi:hypothetical protein
LDAGREGPSWLEISGAVIFESLYFSVFSADVDDAIAADRGVPAVALVSDIPGAADEYGYQHQCK